jgi:purine-cytosine permease-like protein
MVNNMNVGPVIAESFEEMELRHRYALAGRILPTVAMGGLLLGATFGIAGVLLVYLGGTANTDMKLFGQTISTGSVGVASLFIAAVTVVVIMIWVLKRFNNVIQMSKVMRPSGPRP